MWDEDKIIDFEGYKNFILPVEELPTERLKQLAKVKNVLVLNDRARFAPHLNDQFQVYKSEINSKNQSNFDKKVSKMKAGTKSYQKALGMLEKQNTKVNSLWSNELVLGLNSDDEGGD